MDLYNYKNGLHDGLPIGLGYLSVSFGFAIWAVKQGIAGWFLILLSGTNLTSAGQVAGVTVIATAGLLTEMALTELVINLRYALMSITLTQKLDSGFSVWKRLIASFFVTDEIFAVASTRKQLLSFPYMIGLGTLLPAALSAALGIAIYGMFIAILMPGAMADRGVVLAICISIGTGLVLRYVRLFSFLSEGFIIIISALIGAIAAAAIRPIPAKEEESNP